MSEEMIKEAKRIHECRQMKERERKNSIRSTFDRAVHDKPQDRSGRTDHSHDSENHFRKQLPKRATRTRERRPEWASGTHLKY